MFLFNRNKNDSQEKKKLPNRLLDLKASNDIAWVWDPEYKMLIWANDKGLEFWQVEQRHELKELIFPESHAMMQVSEPALKAVKAGDIYKQTLPLKLHPKKEDFKCLFEYQELPDGRDGILVSIPCTTPTEQEVTDNYDLPTTQDNSTSAQEPHASPHETPVLIEKLSQENIIPTHKHP